MSDEREDAPISINLIQMAKKEKWYIFLSLFLGLIPYLTVKYQTPLCGWDCPWYVIMLMYQNYSTFHLLTEPVYYWMFGWLVAFLSPLMVVHLSQIILLIILFTGTYALSRKIGLDPLEAAVVVLFLAFTTGTQRLWWDVLRNFTALAITPWFIYLFIGNRREHYASYIVLIILMLSHRMSLVIIPLIIAYYMTHPKNMKRAAILFLITIIVIPMFFVVVQDKWYYWDQPIKIASTLLERPFDHLAKNTRETMNFAGLPLALLAICGWMMGIKEIFKERKYRFITIFFLFVVLASPFIHVLTSGRLAQFIGLPAGLLIGIYFQAVRRKPEKYPLINQNTFFTMIGIMFMVIMWHSIAVQSHTHPEEIKFMANIRQYVPENSTVIGIGRLYPTWYRIDIQADWSSFADTGGDPNKARGQQKNEVYFGNNTYGKDVYIVDGDSWRWNVSNPTTLYKVSINGTRTFIAKVDYGNPPANGWYAR